MDIHRPETANGYGVLFISGSGWHAPEGYSARPLKSNQIPVYGPALLKAGYTVFAINHRAAPAYRYPAAVHDVQRSVRFIRHHAGAYGIRADRIGAVGGSSGGHLVSLLGVLDGAGKADDADAINRESAKVQVVVARAAPADFLGQGAGGALVSFLGMPRPQDDDKASTAWRIYSEASPVRWVSAGDAPFLLLHGDADTVVPLAHSRAMEKALKAAQVPVKLVVVPGGGHGPDFGKPPNAPDFLEEMVRWLDGHLRN
jgi:acetyl esterase/lipase